MRPGQRFGFSAIEKRDVWNRWKAGQSLHEIGRAFDKPDNCIRSVLLPRGGIPPSTRRRSRLALTLAEREDISRESLPIRRRREATTPSECSYLACPTRAQSHSASVTPSAGTKRHASPPPKVQIVGAPRLGTASAAVLFPTRESLE